MAQLEELQELWQNHATPFVPPMDVRGVAQQLRRFGRNQMWINGVKMVVLFTTGFQLMSKAHWTPLAVAGTILVCGGLLLYIIMDWRNQIGLSRLDFSAPSVAFVRDTRRRLQHQLNPMRKLFWVFVCSIGGGFNLLVAARSSHSGGARVADHVFATAIPFIAYRFGVKIREVRFRRECGAVLEKVDSLLRNVEHQA